MSLGIIIGSDVQDTTNLEDTIELLTFTKQIISNDPGLSFSNNKIIDPERLDSIISWYTGIHTLLTDPAAFHFAEGDQSQ